MRRLDYDICYLVNLETNAKQALTEESVLSYDPADGNRWSIQCLVTGNIDFVKFFRDGEKVSDQYSTPAWLRGDNHGTWINDDKNLKACGKKEIFVSFHTWRGGDTFPCAEKTFEIEPTGCKALPAPTEAPVAAPTEAPVAPPTKAPVPTPTKAPVPAPTDSPTRSPLCPAAKLQQPPYCTVQGNQLCYGHPAEAGWNIEANFHAGDATFFEMPAVAGAKCLTVNSNNFQGRSFWMRFADSCGASDWTWCRNYSVYNNPSNPPPTKAPTRFIAPQTAPPAPPSSCPLPPVSPQCYLWSTKLSYGLDLPSTTEIEVVTSSGLEFSWHAVPGQTYRDVAHLEFVRKNFKLRFRNECGVSEYKYCKNYTPIALDIDRNGAVEHITGNFRIDITGDGEINDLQEWFAPTEGILINMDHGIVDGLITGHHLYGDQGGAYSDGFDKLDDHDVDGDEMVSGEELEGLAIWIDANSNAVLDDGEMSSLSDYGIVALSTEHQNFVSEAHLDDGSTMMMEDLWFVR